MANIDTPKPPKYSEIRIKPAANGHVVERWSQGGSEWSNPVRTVHKTPEHLLDHLAKIFKPPQE